MEQKRMTSNERTAYLRIIACIASLGRSERELKNRLPMVSKGRFWLSSALKSLRTLADNIDATITDNQHESIRRQIHTLSMTVGSTCGGARYDSDNGFWLSFKELDIVGDALKAQCMMCNKDLQQQRQCPVAKLMDVLPIDKTDEHSSGCGFFGL